MTMTNYICNLFNKEKIVTAHRVPHMHTIMLTYVSLIRCASLIVHIYGTLQAVTSTEFREVKVPTP